jgi:hypothetical protein
MASTTISGLNPTLQAIKSMKVAVDRYDSQGLPVETNNLTLEQILELFEIIGNTPPTGTALICSSDTIPSGYLELNGDSFDMALYPQLALIHPSGILPKWNGRTPKHTPDGAVAGTTEEDNVKAHAHTATFVGSQLPNHSHTVGAWYGPTSGSTRFQGGSNNLNTSNKTTSSVSAGKPSGAVTVNSTGSVENTVKGVFVRYMVRAR